MGADLCETPLCSSTAITTRGDDTAEAIAGTWQSSGRQSDRMPEPQLIVLGYGAQSSARARQRDADRGLLHRIRPGVYVDRTVWASANPEQQLRWKARGPGLQRPETVFAGSTAAVLHGLPMLWPLPDRPEIVQPRARRTASTTQAIHRSTLAPPEPVLLDGVAVTSIARTVVDLAGLLSFRRALVPLDAALRAGAGRVDLLEELERARPQAVQRAACAISWADGDAATAGESASRATLLELGYPLPRLQVPIPGTAYDVDLGLLEHGWLFEFDGHAKYQRAEFLRGRTPAEVVIAEKRREDEIRAITGARFLRWTWTEVLRVDPMRRSLARTGIPREPWRGTPRSL